jgi:hypothetical protein
VSKARTNSNSSERKRLRDAADRPARTAATQEIGPLPNVQDPQRRERAAADNLLFAVTYFKPTFYLDWAPYQRRMMDRFQSVLLNGGRECHAVRRAGLKSTHEVVTVSGTGHSLIH